jgi:hypothetical protein
VKNTFNASLLNLVLNSSIREMNKIRSVVSDGKWSKDACCCVLLYTAQVIVYIHGSTLP